MTNQQLKAHCEDVIANPALYCIVDPDGLPYMSEICVATEPGVLEDEVVAMNDDLEDGEPKYTVQPLFFAPPAPKPRLPDAASMADFYENVPEGNRSEPDEAGIAMWNACIEEVKRLNGVKS